VDLDNAPLKVITAKLIRKHGILPIFQRGRRLTVAVSDPTDQQSLNEFQFQSGLSIEPILVEHDVLARIIEKKFSELDSAIAGLKDISLDETVDASLIGDDDASEDSDDAPIVSFVNKVLLD